MRPGHGRQAIVQPRWGNRVGLSRETQGTRRCREPWALESNAVGVCAMRRKIFVHCQPRRRAHRMRHRMESNGIDRPIEPA